MPQSFKQKLKLLSFFGKRTPKNIEEHIDAYIDTYNKYRKIASAAWFKAGLLFTVTASHGIHIKRIDHSRNISELEQKYINILERAKHDYEDIILNIKSFITETPDKCITINAQQINHPALEQVLNLTQQKTQCILDTTRITGYMTRITKRNMPDRVIIIVPPASQNQMHLDGDPMLHPHTVYVLNKQEDNTYSGHKIDLKTYCSGTYTFIKAICSNFSEYIKSGLGREIIDVKNISGVMIKPHDAITQDYYAHI